MALMLETDRNVELLSTFYHRLVRSSTPWEALKSSSGATYLAFHLMAPRFILEASALRAALNKANANFRS